MSKLSSSPATMSLLPFQNNNGSRVKIDDILLQTEEQSAGEIAADSGICNP